MDRNRMSRQSSAAGAVRFGQRRRLGRWWLSTHRSRPSSGPISRSLCLLGAAVLAMLLLAPAALGAGPEPYLVKDINPGTDGSFPYYDTVIGGEHADVGDTLFFNADDGTHYNQLWKSDGTAAGTALVKDMGPGRPDNLTDVDGTLFFTISDSTHGYELWKSDGTEAGTTLVKDINPGSVGSGPDDLTDVGGILFFHAVDGTHGRELWKSDGTEAGTTLVKDINPGDFYTRPYGLTDVGGTLFFIADVPTHVGALWKSDGTEAGTAMVKDPGGDTYPSSLANVGSTLFFVANDLTHGLELWKSDGSAAGTAMVKDINTGCESLEPRNCDSRPTWFTDVGGTLFFTAEDSTHSRELWKSDGTEAGTTLVKDIVPGDDSQVDPNGLTNVGGTLFFGMYGELWKSDGTEAGTTLVSGSFWSYLEELTDVGGTLFFTARDYYDTLGRELWKSDGTEAGTTLVKDINPGSPYSTPAWLTNVGGSLLFNAVDGTHGRELWALMPNPQTTITSGPTGATSNASPSFGFSSSESGSSFECRLDAGTWSACSPPKAYSGLADGAHGFEVRATDPAGNTDPTPASRDFTVDTTPPETTITSGPANGATITTDSVAFGFSSSEASSTFECRLDAGTWSACSSPKSYASLSDGSHTFEVRATDAAGNTDPSPATRTFTVDTTPPDTAPPETTITSGPANGATITTDSVAFGFSSSEAGSTFECLLEPSLPGWQTCESPKGYTLGPRKRLGSSRYAPLMRPATPTPRRPPAPSPSTRLPPPNPSSTGQRSAK